MRLPILPTVIAAVFITILVWLLMVQNEVLMAAGPEMDYLHFNRADALGAEVIMDIWRAGPSLTDAVKHIVWLELLHGILTIVLFNSALGAP